ncbi:hypothetical protein [Rhodocyclus tenuis]|uniref:EAL domain-containing protein (Putative c-di-GMP-specific phosphodiesterase class I) n=1 Tax=Rhodocyclus tenuis TaxID=1066 RepID=A0A840G469_RHOTE|nr:hypothetical protein [Rhodocyclus tenuis]MBB4246121.1 EAL domain-containing protein (putative c-di-GMP-specific phosphodiesterase class I) [Rhodocyclus tenuis]
MVADSAKRRERDHAVRRRTTQSAAPAIGYSSLAWLTRFRRNEIRIERSFADGIGSNPDDHAIACPRAQGFLFSAALPPATLAERVLSRRQA